MKTSYFLAAAFFLTSISQAFAGNNSIAIGSVSDLEMIRADLNADYILVADLNMAGINFEPIGGDPQPFIQGSLQTVMPVNDNEFRGSFDGNGHTISNLTINQPNATGVGFFRETLGAEIKNLTLLNPTVICASDAGILVAKDHGKKSHFKNLQIVNGSLTLKGNDELTNLAGGMLGTLGPESVLESVSANISIDLACPFVSYAGGLVGYVYGGSVLNVSVNSNIQNSVSVISVTDIGGLMGYISDVSDCLGNAFHISKLAHASANTSIQLTQSPGVFAVSVGGLAGEVQSTPVENVYATGSITGASFTGGLIGHLRHSDLKKSYASVVVTLVSSGFENGPLVGKTSFPPFSVTASFWNSTLNPGMSSAYGTALTQAQMQTSTPFINAGWSTVDWTFARNSLPTLKTVALVTPTVTFIPGDLDLDLDVDGADLSILLANWNGSGISDIDQNGTTNGADLSLLLCAWSSPILN